MSQDRLWIMVDVETSGPVIGRHSLTELGAVVGTPRDGVLDRFEVLIAPMPDWLRAASISDSVERARTSRSVLPPWSSSCIWKPPDTPRPGIAGGTSAKAAAFVTPARRSYRKVINQQGQVLSRDFTKM